MHHTTLCGNFQWLALTDSELFMYWIDDPLPVQVRCITSLLAMSHGLIRIKKEVASCRNVKL